jgi:hypothetical protein
MKSGFALILCSFVVSAAGFARAQPAESPGSISATSQPDAVPARRTMTAVRMTAEESIVVDGRLDDAAWARAMPATDFIQLDPLNGSPATERFGFTGDVSLQTDMANQPLSRIWNLTVLNVDLHSQDVATPFNSIPSARFWAGSPGFAGS